MSGKQSRKQRHTPVPAPASAPRGARRQASPKVLLGAAAVVVLIAVGVGLGIAFSGGGSSSSSTTVPARGSLVNALPGAPEVQTLFKGIPQSGNTLGSSSAPVTLIEYADLQCPYCREFDTQLLPTVVSRYVRAGKVAVEFRLMAFVGPESVAGRAAAIAAGEQGRMFNFIQILYDNQGAENTGWLDDRMLTAAAASIPGLDVPRLLSDRSSSTVSDKAGIVDEQAKAASITSTPTILVGKTGSTPKIVALTSPTDTATLTAAIDAALP